jgi:hypothetical protein
LLFDPLYLAVSGVMWCWHQLFGFLLGPASGAAWALSVVFLVLTLRALLIRPFLAQMRSARVMRELAPQLAELRARHSDDPARLFQETSALQRAHGVSAASTLLPALLQVPVFLGREAAQPPLVAQQRRAYEPLAAPVPPPRRPRSGDVPRRDHARTSPGLRPGVTRAAAAPSA